MKNIQHSHFKTLNEDEEFNNPIPIKITEKFKKNEQNRSLSPENLNQNNSLSKSKHSRNNGAISPSQKSTRMVSKQTKASDGAKMGTIVMTDDAADQILEENSDSAFHNGSKIGPQSNRESSKTPEPSEIKLKIADEFLVDHKDSDMEMLSQLSKPKSTQKKSIKKSSVKKSKKAKSAASDLDVEIMEPGTKHFD